MKNIYTTVHVYFDSSGFWIRFTVHYNLCMGSIVGLGSKEQVDICNNWQQEGYLGNLIL